MLGEKVCRGDSPGMVSGGGDALDGEPGVVLSGVCGVIEFARDLMKFDFQRYAMGQAEMFIAEPIQFGVEQRTEFPCIGRGGASDANGARPAHEKER
jgi:hypothetical protein